MKHTDMGCIIVSADVTHKGTVSHVIDLLRKTSPELQLGIVINAAKYYGEYGYSYKNGYKE